MSYSEENPVLSIRVPLKHKKRLGEIAENHGVKLMKLCAGVLATYLKQSDLFEIVYKGDKTILEVEK